MCSTEKIASLHSSVRTQSIFDKRSIQEKTEKNVSSNNSAN
jgi:hypothetical protein